MPEDGPPAAGFFLRSITRQDDVVVYRSDLGTVVVVVFGSDLGTADNDLTDESYLATLLGPLMVDSDLDDKNFSSKLGHAEQRIHEGCVLKEQPRFLGFHCISSPNNAPEEEHLGAFDFPYSTGPKYYLGIKKEYLVPEIEKEYLRAVGFPYTTGPKYYSEIKKEHLGALGTHFITSPKTAPGSKKECPELWRFHVATYPKFIPGMPRLSPSLNALGTPPTSGNSDTEFIIYLDSGASCHVVHQDDVLINLRDPPPGLTRVKVADGSLLTVSGFGDIQTKNFSIPDVCLVKGLKVNLVSVGQLVNSRKVSCTFTSGGCDVTYDGSSVGSAVFRGDNQYVLNILKIQ